MNIPPLGKRKSRKANRIPNINLESTMKDPAAPIDVRRLPWKKIGIAGLVSLIVGSGYMSRDAIMKQLENVTRAAESVPVTTSPIPAPVQQDSETKQLRQQIQAMRIELDTLYRSLEDAMDETDVLRSELIETRNRIALEIMHQTKVTRRIVDLLAKYAEVDFQGHRQVRKTIQLMESRGKR